MSSPQFRYNPLTNKLDLSDTAGGGGGSGPQASFYSYLSATLANATGDSTVVNPVPFNMFTTNIGSGFNPSTGIFTAPFNGSYVFTSVIYLTNLSSGHTAGAGAFILNGSQQFKAFDLNPYVVSEGTDLSQTCCSGIVKMSAGDTMQITLQVGPLSSKTVGIGGGIGISNFSGFLINSSTSISGSGIKTITGDAGGPVSADANGNLNLVGSTHVVVDGTQIANEQQVLLTGFNQNLPVIGGLAGDLAQTAGGNSGDVYTSQGAGHPPHFAPPASSSPLTTKGDLYGFSTVNARVPVGAPGYTLTANPSAATGVDWEQITSTANAVVFNPGKVVTLVDDFFSTFLGNSSDGRVGNLGWQTYGGQWSQNVGTAANPGIAIPSNMAFATMTLDNSDGTASVQPGAGQIQLNYVLKLSTLSALGNRYTFQCGLGASPATNGIIFQYSDNVNSGNWQIVCTKQGVGTTTTNTSIAAVTGYVNLGITINSAGTSVTFTVNGVVSGTIATANIPTAAISPIVAFQRTSGSLPAAAAFDLFYMVTTLNNNRSAGVVIPIGTTTVAQYTATAVSYQVLVTDSIIGVTDTSSARTITMPNSGMATGQSWQIKDESGAAGTNAITISGNGVNIDGASTTTIGNNYGAVELYWNGSQFFIT